MHETVTQRKQVRLDETEMWLIATYCIENHCVTRYEGQDGYTLRVRQTTIAVEINKQNILGKTINAHHVKTAMDWYMHICLLFKQAPFQTPKENSGEIEKLNERLLTETLAYDNMNERLAASIMHEDKLEKDLARCEEECKKLDNANKMLRGCFTDVRQHLSGTLSRVAELFDIK
jgi:flagellar motility protein MotE (MotC chaperone)